MERSFLFKLGWLAVAGALGTLARWALAGFVQRQCGSLFPWGTLAVNVTGSVLFGLVFGLVERRMVPAEAHLIVLGGFMGAFTTFSAFSFETVQLMREARWLLAGVNVLLQNALGFAGLFLGTVLAGNPVAHPKG